MLFHVMEEVEITEKAIFLYASHMLGRTPKKSTVVSKKLSDLVSKNLRTTCAILVSVTKRSYNKNFLRTISDSMEFSSEGFKSNS